MKKLSAMLLIGLALTFQVGCDDVLEDLEIDIGYYPGTSYGWSGPEVYYEDRYVEEYWYEESYYEESWYDDYWYDDWSFDLW